MALQQSRDHKPEIDNLSPAAQRCVLERLLMIMLPEQRQDLMAKLPTFYEVLYPSILK